MKIVIPTYNRYTDFKTLELLEGYEDITYIFVVEEELLFYKNNYGDKWRFIVGVKGLKDQRNFITNYFDDNEILVCMDDDISSFNIPLKEWLPNAVKYLKESEYGLLTLPSTTMYMKDTIDFKLGNYFGIGVFHILKNHKDFQLNYSQAEDYERSILYIQRYKFNLRIRGIYFKTKYFGKGGLEDYRTIEQYVSDTNRIVYQYSDYLYFKDKKIMRHSLSNVNLYRKFEIKSNRVMPLGYYNCYDELYNMFKQVSLVVRQGSDKKDTNNRRGFPKYRGAIFGMVRPRFKYKGYNELSNDSKKYPHIYEEIWRIGKIICPFEFNSVQVNHNLVCPPHIDSNNRGLSLLVSFGDYTGCNIVVNDMVYDARHRPIVFNGARVEHYNTNDLVGDKYSLVFFS